VDEPCQDTTGSGKKPSWISRAFSDANGVPSASRILFAIAVGFALGLASGALSLQRILTPEIVGLVETVIWATAAGYGVGKFASPTGGIK
jgi:hypothetical protein